MTVSVALLRRCFLGLAATAIIGTAVELALSRHWATAIQLIPWYAVGGLTLAFVLAVFARSDRMLRIARTMIVVVVLSSAYGIYEHVLANYHAGPLDFRYTDRWAAMSGASRWWAAISESVGPSPTLAPAVLAQAAACLLFATIGRTSGTADSVQRTRSRAKASSSS